MKEIFQNRIVFLGTGTSSGIPVIGCRCPACVSADPRDKRTRTSALLQTRKQGEEDWQHLLIDSGIDLRYQLLREGAPLVRDVVYTHAHVDHFFGLDELRAIQFVTRKSIHLYASEDVENSLRIIYRHLFEKDVQQGGGILAVEVHRIERRFLAGAMELEALPIFHGRLPILGFRFGDLAYLTDCSHIPDETWHLLKGVKVLVLDMLRKRPHPTHFNLEQSIEVVEKLQPHETYFVHMTHDLVHAEIQEELPDGVWLAHDGLIVDLPPFDPICWTRD